MILYNPNVIVQYRDYGIMLPIAPDRSKQIIEFIGNVCPVVDFAGAAALLKKELSALMFNRQDLERVHSKDYTAGLYGEKLEAFLLAAFELVDDKGLPNRYEPDKAKRPLTDMFETLLAQASGTYLSSLLAMEHKNFCCYMGGGMHHARYDAGSGFCLINDIAISACKLVAETPIQNLWIIDLDAHKGDGTAELVQFARSRGELFAPTGTPGARDKPCILTLSIHMAKGWPLDKESLAKAQQGRAPLLASDVDIGIDAGEENSYTARLAAGIGELERISGTKPELAIVVDGADPYEHDGLPSSSLMRLTLEQCVERDVYVYDYLQERNIPSAWIQSGGYGDRAWEPTAHFLQRIYKRNTP
jgi:acetoin utilization deacetylase AcuC-like enzyme